MKNEKFYNKLVRDKIPEIIEKTGKKFTTHIAKESEYKSELLNKVYEELQEFKENPCEEEMADIFEVLEGIMEAYGIDVDQMFEIKQKKSKEKGSFDKRIILERIWEDQ